jgi:hypothetical protein
MPVIVILTSFTLINCYIQTISQLIWTLQDEYNMHTLSVNIYDLLALVAEQTRKAYQSITCPTVSQARTTKLYMSR